MAELTADLPRIERPEHGAVSPINPGPAGPSWLGGLAEGATRLIGAASTNWGQQQAIDAKDATNDAIIQGVKTITSNMNDYRNQQGLPTQAGPPPLTPDAQANVAAAAADHASVQKAVDQGKLANNAVAISAENITSSLLQQHPDQAAAVLAGLKEAGVTHYLGHDLDVQQQIQDNRIATQEATKTGLADLAVKSGAALPDEPFESQVAKGQAISASAAQLAAASAKLKYASELQTYNKTQADIVRENATRDILKVTQGQVDQDIGTQTDRLANIQMALGDNPSPEDLKNYATLVPQVQAYAETYKAHTLAMYDQMAGATPEGRNQLVTMLDEKLKDFNTHFTGDLTRDKANSSLLALMTDKIGIDSATAFPLLSRLTKSGVFTPSTLAAALGGTFPAPIMETIQKEIKGIQLAPDEASSEVQIYNLKRTLSNESTVLAMNPADAKKVVGNLMPMVPSLGSQILGGDKTDTTKSQFISGAANLASAAIAQPVGTTDFSTTRAAVSAITDQKTVGALVKLSTDPTSDALPVAQMLNSANTKMINVIKTADQGAHMVDDISGKKIAYNASLGQFAIVPDPESANRIKSKGAYGYGTGPFGAGLTTGLTVPPNSNAPPSQDMKDTVASLNASLNTAVTLSKFDHSLPAGAKERDIRSAYATGQVPTEWLTKNAVNKGKSVGDLIQEDKDQLNSLTSTYQTSPGTRLNNAAGEQYYSGYFNQAEKAFGVPAPILSFVAKQESGFDPNAHNPQPGSTSQGLMGFVDKTAEKYGVTRGNPVSEIMGAAHYLKDLHDQNGGDWEEALRQYGTLAKQKGQSGQSHTALIHQFRTIVGGQSQSGGQ